MSIAALAVDELDFGSVDRPKLLNYAAPVPVIHISTRATGSSRKRGWRRVGGSRDRLAHVTAERVMTAGRNTI